MEFNPFSPYEVRLAAGRIEEAASKDVYHPDPQLIGACFDAIDRVGGLRVAFGQPGDHEPLTLELGRAYAHLVEVLYAPRHDTTRFLLGMNKIPFEQIERSLESMRLFMRRVRGT